MEALRLERERQKKELELQRSTLQSTSSGPKKFLKRGDIQRAKDDELDRESQERVEKRLKVSAADSALSAREVSPAIEIKFVRLPKEEVIKRLRALVQPITYFGESDEERQRRLHQVELVVAERQHGSSAGAQKNIFQMMSESVDAEIEAAIAAGVDQQDQESDAESGDDQQPSAAQNISSNEETNSKRQNRPRSEFSNDEEFALTYLKNVLKEWEEELELRPEADKRTAHGKHAKATWHQTRQYLKPLFKQLKRKTCAADIVEYARLIVTHCQSREYVKANDCYLQMSIGNAPWPMGVSMAGIHERSGRDKLEEKHSAHILNDEVQRKFIMSIKRLMTYAQHKYPAASNSQNCG